VTYDEVNEETVRVETNEGDLELPRVLE